MIKTMKRISTEKMLWLVIRIGILGVNAVGLGSSLNRALEIGDLFCLLGWSVASVTTWIAIFLWEGERVRRGLA
jgi:hypothetical protein